MQSEPRVSYPDLVDFKVLGNLSRKLANLSPKEKERIEGMLATLRVRWNSIEINESFPHHPKLRGAYYGLQELWIVTRHLSEEMTTEAPEIKVAR